MTSPSQRRWIIGEVGSVHDGSFGNACKLIELAARCGANVVKFQTHIAEAETLENAPAPSYFKAEPRFAYFKRTAFSREQWLELAKVARDNGLMFMSSPFAIEAVDQLEETGIDIYKIASGEVTNTPLLERVAKTGKPVILSSGMSDWRELDRAVAALRSADDLTVMQCTSAYPCPVERAGVNVLTEIAARYQVATGLSDHTQGIAAAVAAVVLGATAVEKHFTFSRHMYGSDAQFAAEPDEFRRYCSEIKDAWKLLDHPVDKSDLDSFREMKQVFEKSIVTAVEVRQGQRLAREMLAFKKPGTGIRADRLDDVLGKQVVRDLPKDHMLSEKDFQ
ncbi:MAG TPA: N-acetylneuraminate synthase family protein [Kofleriaceae bacterium]